MSHDQESQIATSVTLGVALCAALGLDASKVLSLRIELDSGDVARLVVTRIVTSTQGMAVCELLTQRFDMVERGEATRQAVRASDSELDLSRP